MKKKTSRHLIRRALKWVVSLHGRPQDIALGFAIGMFVAFTPTLGFQMVLAAFLATLVGASRAASIIPVWITNPLTIPPIYGTTYYIGSFFWPRGQSFDVMYSRLQGLASRLESLSFLDVFDRFRELAKFGYDVIVPMTIGGIVVGLVAGGVTYPVTLWILRQAHDLYQRQRQALAHRREQAQSARAVRIAEARAAAGAAEKRDAERSTIGAAAQSTSDAGTPS